MSKTEAQAAAAVVEAGKVMRLFGRDGGGAQNFHRSVHHHMQAFKQLKLDKQA